MGKSLNYILKQDKEKFRIPKSVQDVIPITALYEDGIFQVAKNKYSKTFLFTDVNFAVASEEEKQIMQKKYLELLKSLDSSATTKITINNRRLNSRDFKERSLISEREDGLNEFRAEYNQILMNKAARSNSIVQDKYITVSIYKRSIEEARQTFVRISQELGNYYRKLGSRCMELDATERLRILHDFYRTGEESDYYFDLTETMEKGHNFKDYICPDTMEFCSDCFTMGSRYGRVLFIKEYASRMKDDIISELTGISRNMMMSIDIIPTPMDEAIKELENKILGVETNITSWQRRQNANLNFSAVIPYDMEQQRKALNDIYDKLTIEDEKLMYGVVTIVHTAESKSQLEEDTKAITTTAIGRQCQLGILRFQQMDGLNTVLPIGHRKIDALRTFLSKSLTAFMPFKVQEIQHEHGLYYGQNCLSQNMIMADRRLLLNGNSFIIGVSGSGKSFAAKNEIVNLILATNADVIIIDPEKEYAKLVNALGGEVVVISANSPNHINAMDMCREEGQSIEHALNDKIEFMKSLCEQIVAGNEFETGQPSIIDRCTKDTYKYYLQGNCQGTPPTLQDFREELLKQDEEAAHSLALELEQFTRGSLNTFAQQTNVNTENRLICYDIFDLGEALRAVGMLVILDSILNRIIRNREKRKLTFIFIDEIYLLFMHQYSAEFFRKLWKRVRKYGGYCTGITQNAGDLVQSSVASTMLANSQFLIILNQFGDDREILAQWLHISKEQMDYISEEEVGKGLIKVGNVLVPFENKFPINSKLYQLMTTKPGEGM